MIPTRLVLRNFMSYGAEPTVLDFAGMHVACLSGDNGNGKSALLDAITYALWGKTRVSGSASSSDDDLIRLGADEMEVTFEFLLGDDRYRVVRKRSRRTRSGDWQVQLCDSSGTYRPVGGSSMRETERYLVHLLRMEYETFLNSAYIQQGRADEFTRQKPDARKRILADILDLSRYDRLEQMAKDRRDECAALLKELEGEIRFLEERAGEEAAHRERLTAHETALAAETVERDRGEARVSLLRAQLAALDEKARRLQERQERLREVEAEVAEIDSAVVRLQEKMARDAALLAERAAIEADYARLQEARRQAAALEEQVAGLRPLEQEQADLQRRIEAARQALLREADRAQAESRHVEERARRIEELDARIGDVSPKLVCLEQAEADAERVRQELAAAQQEFADLSARNQQIRRDIADIDDVLALLKQPRPTCPVCTSDLGGGKQKVVVDRQQQRRKALEGSLADVKRDGAEKRRLRDALQQQADAMAAQLRGAAALRAQLLEWQRTRGELAAQNADAAAIRERAVALHDKALSGAYAADERARLAEVAAAIAGLQEAARRHEEARAAVRELTSRDVERRNVQLEEAGRAQTRDAAELARLGERRAKRASQVEAERARQQTMRAELAEHDALRREAANAEAALRQAAERCEETRGHLERCRQALDDIARAAEQAAAKRADRDKVAKDRQAYTELAAAFGKKGVQALIIDNALPEVQDEANRLLARMTDSAMQIALSTLRQARAGAGQIETLDISITDDAGTRPYEMFSGGEAFRVNFALRIALSRLLARRAGARLQTLILDEGFGTQDAKGRERLVEAIEAIKDEFALILVISHIEELKDAFPTRIEVTKTPAGSQISYFE